jgi:hypothetical protein
MDQTFWKVKQRFAGDCLSAVVVSDPLPIRRRLSGIPPPDYQGRANPDV